MVHFRKFKIGHLDRRVDFTRACTHVSFTPVTISKNGFFNHPHFSERWQTRTFRKGAAMLNFFLSITSHTDIPSRECKFPCIVTNDLLPKRLRQGSFKSGRNELSRNVGKIFFSLVNMSWLQKSFWVITGNQLSSNFIAKFVPLRFVTSLEFEDSAQQLSESQNFNFSNFAWDIIDEVHSSNLMIQLLPSFSQEDIAVQVIHSLPLWFLWGNVYQICFFLRWKMAEYCVFQGHP